MYEVWGFLPPTSRALNGYRLYTEFLLVERQVMKALNAGVGIEPTILQISL